MFLTGWMRRAQQARRLKLTSPRGPAKPTPVQVGVTVERDNYRQRWAPAVYRMQAAPMARWWAQTGRKFLPDLPPGMSQAQLDRLLQRAGHRLPFRDKRL